MTADESAIEIDMELDEEIEEILRRYTRPGEEAAFIRDALYEKAARIEQERSKSWLRRKPRHSD